MSDVTINYKGVSIATMDASGTKTLLTEGKYCEDDIEVVYVSPGGGGGGYGGTITPTERLRTLTFYAPNCTYLACGAETKPDLTTGKGFVYSFFCSNDRYDCSRSNNSGTGTAAEAFATANPSVSYANGTFTLYFATWNNSTKTLQPGVTYNWRAW